MNTFLRFPNGLDKAITLSFDDGVFQDIRLAKILSNNGMKCTFNVNSSFFGEADAEGSGVISKKQAKELYANSDHEVAIHGATHPFLESLPTHLAINDILKDRKKLEEMFGTIIRGMAYPFGTYSDDLVEALKYCGIAYSRTTITTEDFAIPSDWLRLPTTCHYNNPKLFKLCDKFLTDKYMSKPKLFYIWGHSYEFDLNNDWHIIETFAEKMGNRDDIWYATNIEIYNYVTAYNRLVFSVENRIVYNPNAQPIWFYCEIGKEKKTIKVGTGEVLKF